MVEVFRNPCITDWESFRTDLSGYLGSITDNITDFMDLETAAGQFQDAIICVNDNCPLTMRNNTNVHWCNRDIAEKEEKCSQFI
jgi:hypothetical protein